ncbi:MAG: hypothetical protein KAI70_00690 [Candidatus Omnitrophica bacterium]|nr:hypothetical protein [Candidatus Omnitrophota bacterium]
MAKEPELIQSRHDTATNWTAANPTLEAGEVGFETDTGQFKVGDGSNLWASLTYFTQIGMRYLKSYTVVQVATLTPASYARGMVWVSDEAGGAQPAYCNGTNWKRFSDGATVS